MFDLDYPAMLGVVQNQDSYAQGVAAQRPFYFDHIADAHRPGVRRVRRAHRPPLRARRRLPARRRRVRDRRAGLGRRATPRPSPTTCARHAAAHASACSNLHDVPPVPGRSRRRAPRGQEGRRRARAHRPAARRRSAAPARDPRRDGARPSRTARAARRVAAARRASPRCSAERGARLLLRLLRARQPRPAARRPRRRGRQHAPRRRRGGGSSISASTSCAKDTRLPEAPDLAGEAARGAIPTLARAGARAARATSTCCPKGAISRAHPLGRRLGRDHDGEEPRR